LAAEVAAVLRDARTFESLSATASALVIAQPSFAAHVLDVLGFIDGFVRQG
jgi:hypothetical protein